MRPLYITMFGVLLLFILGIYLYTTAPKEVSTINTNGWSTYTNEQFGFSLMYPPEWQVYEAPNDPIAPKFNIYKPGSDEQTLPLTHHSPNVTHVSVFPKGIPTEGIFGESETSTVSFSVPTNQARDYLLSDGTHWSTFAGIDTTHPKWNDSGFIFARTNIQDEETTCFRDTEFQEPEQCDPLTGDRIIRHGTINAMDRAIQEAILSSFTIEEVPSVNNDLIRVVEPQPQSVLTSPLTVRGEARGQWYFEATFGLKLLDANGDDVPIEPGYVMTENEWMTEAFVPFESTHTFNPPSTETGTLVFERANPSGLPENADEIRIPIHFDATEESQRTIQLYYHDPRADTDSDGNISCSQQGLVAVERMIPVTQTPTQDAVRLLLRGELTTQEQADGITTEYPLEGFELIGASSANGTLTLNFNDPNNATSGGSCRSSILWLQIQKTASQFNGVDSVRFIPETLFQP